MSEFEEGNLNLGYEAEEVNQDAMTRSTKLEFQDVRREVEMVVSGINHCRESLQVEIYIQREDFNGRECGYVEEATPSFRLDYFNFPIVDNTRLAYNHRLAAVIEEFDIESSYPRVEITLVVFPPEYASLRDRPGMEEVRRQLESAMEFESGANK